MKNLIPFWTPIRSRQHPFLECVDAYFHIRGPVATAVGISATLHDAPSRYKHLKLLSYASLLPPLILLICKYFLRKKHHFILPFRIVAVDTH